MHRGEQREHIPTVASSYGSFLHALSAVDQPCQAKLPSARLFVPFWTRVRAAFTWRRLISFWLGVRI